MCEQHRSTEEHVAYPNKPHFNAGEKESDSFNGESLRTHDEHNGDGFVKITHVCDTRRIFR